MSILKIKQLTKIRAGQDGAIFKNYLFRFESTGECFVYDLNSIDSPEAKMFSCFSLDKSEKFAPHSNAVMFGNEYFDDNDECPLLYSNIYNNFANAENKLKGVCLVYRIMRNGNKFSSTLVQMIEIGFAENPDLWCSEDKSDVRPYGNFVLDAENGNYYGFTMIDKSKMTRYFSFKLPKLSDGEKDSVFGVKKVVLNESDIKASFDCEYHHFIQGACFYDGKIYSLEGFEPGEHPPVLRIIDVEAKKQAEAIDLVALGLEKEPEFIDFKDGVCYYGDNPGNLYIIEF